MSATMTTMSRGVSSGIVLQHGQQLVDGSQPHAGTANMHGVPRSSGSSFRLPSLCSNSFDNHAHDRGFRSRMSRYCAAGCPGSPANASTSPSPDEVIEHMVYSRAPVCPRASGGSTSSECRFISAAVALSLNSGTERSSKSRRRCQSATAKTSADPEYPPQ